MASSSEVNDAVDALRHNPADREAARRLHLFAHTDRDTVRRTLPFIQVPAPQPDLGLPQKPRLQLHDVSMPMPFSQVDPESVGALREVMAQAAADWRPMRGVGGQYSFSNIAFTDGFFIRMTSKLRSILSVDTDVLKKSNQETLVSFEGGATVDDINTYLWSKGLAVYNQPGFGQLSYAGAMVSGAHGSGITLGPLASYARSIRLFTIDEQHRVVDLCVEPENGITDPTLWHRKHPDVEIVQDDDLFQSVVVSAGCLGVIHSMTIAVRTCYYLSETRERSTWGAVKENLGSYIGPDAKHQSVAIWLNPYPVGSTNIDTASCIVGTYDYTTQTTSLNKRGIGIVLGGTQALLDVIGWISNVARKAVPTLIDVALDATADQGVVMTAPEALNFGPPNNIRVVASASGFAVGRLVEAVEAVMALLAQRSTETGCYLTSPIGLRFVRKGEAYLGPQYGRDTCMMETPSLAGTTGAEETLFEIHRMLATRFDARPHWGQINHLGAEILQPRFPRFCQFLDAFAVLNPKGFFDNAFTEQLGLRRAVRGGA